MADMVKVQMPDGTVLQFPDTMTREAMQQAAASWWSQNGPQAAPETAVRTPAPATRDPMLPSPDTDTRSTEEYLRDTGQAEQPLVDVRGLLEAQPQRPQGGAAADLMRSGVSGAARGATELAALPDTLGSGLDYVYERLGLIPPGSRQNVPSVSGVIRGAASDITSGGTEYRPQTTGGEYAQTVGEFIGGGAGPRVGTVAGLLSEGAGQATEGTSLEPYARLAGGVVGSILGQPRVTQAPVRNPNTAAGQRAAMANQLRSEGVNVTAGQQANSPLLRRLEGTLDAPDVQPAQLTQVLMRRIGSNSDIASPQALASTYDDIIKQMDDAVAGVSVVPNARHATAADDVAATYLSKIETGDAVARVREIAQSISARASSGQPISLDDLKTFRIDIGELTTRSNPVTRRAAHALRRLIDDMTDTALQNAGRSDDIANLAAARTRFRDFLAIRDAATRANAEDGILSMTALNESFKRVMGRENWGVGRTTDAADFARSAAAMTRSAPAVQSGGIRDIANLPMLLTAGGGYAATGSPLGAIAGAALPPLGQMGMRSAPIQNLLINPATVLGQATRAAPGLLAQQ